MGNRLIRLSISALFLLMGHMVLAQTQIQMGSAASVQTCYGTFYDPGGNNTGGNPPQYPGNDYQTMAICPASGNGFVNMTFFNWSIGQGDTMWIYNGSSTAAPLLGTFFQGQSPGTIASIPASNPSGCLYIVWQSDATDEGIYSATVSCDAPCQQFTANFTSPTNFIDTSDTYIYSCQQDSIVLDAYGIYSNNNIWYQQVDSSTTFSWVFSDSVLTHTGPQFSIPIDTTGGAYRVTLLANDTNGCPIYEAAVKYILVSTSPDFSDTELDDTILCYNETSILNIDVVSPAWSNSDPGFVAGTIALPDGSGSNPGVYTSNLTIAMFNSGDTIATVTDINHFFLNVEHSFIGDLDISISCPNGNSATLKSFPGGGGRWLGEACDGSLNIPGVGWNYYWPTTAPNLGTMNAVAGACAGCPLVQNPCNIAASGTTLDSNTYTPVTAFGSLVGCPLNGNWTVTVVDQWAIDDGTLFSWGIDFDSAILPTTVINYQPVQDSVWVDYDPNLANVTVHAPDSLEFDPLVWDTTVDITVYYLDNFGCTYDTSLSFYVNGPCHSTCRNGNALNPGMYQVGCPGDSTGYAYVQPDTTLIQGPFTYSWKDVNGTVISQTLTPTFNHDTVLNLPVGLYSVFVTDFYGCTDSVTIAVGQVSQMVSIIQGIQQTTCNGPGYCDGQATVNTYFGSQPYSYLWSGGDTTVNAVSLCGGANWVEITDGRGCVDTVQLSVPQPDPIGVTAWGDDTICVSNALQVYSQATGGQAPYIYYWSSGDSVQNALLDPIYTQTYTVVATDQYLCPSDTDTVTVYVRDPLSLSFNTPDTICVGDTAEAVAFPTGGDGMYQYAWQGGFSTDSIAKIPAPVSGYYALTLTDVCGSPAITDSVYIQVGGYPSIRVSTLGSDTICIGESRVISAWASGGNGEYTYTWDSGLGNGRDHLVAPTQNTVYTVTVNDNCGSQVGIGEIKIIVGQFSDISLFASPEAQCSPGEFSFALDTLPSNYNIQFNYGEGWRSFIDEDSVSVVLTDPGCYDVRLNVITSAGCETKKRYNCMVQVWPNPTAGFSYDPIHPSIQEPEVHFYDSSSGANSKFWTISTGDTILQDNFMYIFPKEDSATYIVKQFVSTGKGCSDTAAMRVIVDFVTTFYVPDAFTPDGNDVNETFGPKTYGVQVEDFRMEIYNRWGEQIWVTDTFGVEWDGSILGSGEQADKGAYTWVIYYREQTGLMQVQRGNVLLLR